MPTKMNYKSDAGNAAATTDALAATDGTLSQFDRTRAILADTHDAIPRLIAEKRRVTAELGAAELSGGTDIAKLRSQLEAVENEYATASRRRQSAMEALLVQESGLQACKASVTDSLNRHTAAAVKEFRSRYDAAVRTLQQLWAEGDALAAALRTKIDLPLPCTITQSAADLFPRLARIMTADTLPSALDPATARLGETVDCLDAALQICASIRASGERNQRHSRLAETRIGMPAQMGGVFVAVQNFTCPTDGLPFERGVLVDASLLGDGGLYRLVSARVIRPVDTVTRAAA